MAKNVQNVTLSMTLPISCQICFGKVRKPTICCNLHIFCAACIELWLQKCSQCPTCRVPITPENPCREIIGATNESQSNESHLIKRHLRKTRGELLLREYEDELEAVLKENEELKSRSESLEAQLKASLKPADAPTPAHDAPPDSALLRDTANKLQAATELYQRLQEDISKLKEANKSLRSQNVHLLQENLRLRAEVDSRSPQKFGRFTVAALEAKISQYEREMSQLKKALERSDAYIEELESQSQSAASSQPTPAVGRLSESDVASADPSDSQVPLCDEASAPQKDPMAHFAVPSTPPTPCSVLGRLSLRSPAARREKKDGSHRLPYLRRLSFDDCGSSSGVPAAERSSPEVGSSLFDRKPSVNSSNQQSAWSVWEEPGFGSKPSAQDSERNLSESESSAEEAEMNAAFLNIVSELHSMLAEGESSRSHAPQVSPDVPAEATEPGSAGEQQRERHAPDAPDSASESVKRKCSSSLATSSPSKLSRTK